MKERPILFSAPMVQAILAGRKTQTRRALKVQPSKNWKPYSYGEVHKMVNGSPDPDKVIGHGYSNYDGDEAYACKFGQVGDQLWVREAFGEVYDTCEHPEMDSCPDERWHIEWKYRADGEQPVIEHGCFTGWKPSIYMPREASRILLEITDIRVERLQDISAADALAEGITHRTMNCPKHEYYQLWNSIHGELAHEENPWVWVVSFRVVQGGDL